jgi:hypothetical protein
VGGGGASAVFTLCIWRCVVILAKYRNGVESQTPILCCSLHQAQIQMSIILVIRGMYMNFVAIHILVIIITVMTAYPSLGHPELSAGISQFLICLSQL